MTHRIEWRNAGGRVGSARAMFSASGVLTLLVAGFVSQAVGVEFDAGKLAAIRPRMQAFVDQRELSGAVTVVGNAQGIVSFEAVGMSNIAQQRPMSADTLFRIASMTKPITALGIMILVDEGKIAVDDPVEKYLPEFQGQMLVASKADGVVTLKKPSRVITVRDLLTHTSGLPGGFPSGVNDLYGRRHLSLAEAVLVSSQQPLDFEPGAKWAYCNAGIDALGRIIEVVAAEPFESFMSRRIFQPLGMKNTFFYPPADRLPRIAATYDVKDGQLVEPPKLLIGPTENARHPIPAGGLFSTGGDLARLYQTMLNRGQLGDARIVSPAAVATMTKVQTGDLECGFVPGMSFGFGWAVVREPKDVTAMLSPGTYGHGGAFGTQGWIDPQRGLFVILLIQRVGLKNGDASEMRRELQRIAVDAARPAKLRVYIGTNTGGASKGIYRSELDLATGKLAPATLAGEVVSPSFLAIHPSQKFLYAVTVIDDVAGKKTGAVGAFAIDAATGDLRLLNKQPSGGGGPCHVVVDKAGRNVLVANYGGGSVASLPIQDDGSLAPAKSVIQHQGMSVDKQRQGSPHAHSINLDAGNRFAFAADLGLDKVLVYRFDPTAGTIVAHDPPAASVEPGSGPRHFAFHPNGKFAYVINEISLTVTAFAYDADKGALTPVQTITTLPEGADRTGASTAEVQVHPSGKFLYGSNRGHNTIAVFSIHQATGKLTVVGHQGQDVKVPRNFGVDPTGQFAVVANQDGDSLVVFRIDPSTGNLEPTGHKIEVPKPVCVKFLP